MVELPPPPAYGYRQVRRGAEGMVGGRWRLVAFPACIHPACTRPACARPACTHRASGDRSGGVTT
ncbi:protein of unknown function [Streptomyces sp. KY70]|nr:protein of unknown function [Streptomyces sp. KY70]